MEETTDVGADRRRVERILRQLGEHPGEHAAELLVLSRDGERSLLRLPPVADIDALALALQPLLGVLGRAERAGDAIDAIDDARVAVAAAGAG
jgi:hypothetical protein